MLVVPRLTPPHEVPQEPVGQAETWAILGSPVPLAGWVALLTVPWSLTSGP